MKCASAARLGASDVPALAITSDNGKEFAGHASVAAELGAGFCFAQPCHSRECGPDEHVNGLAGVCFPKKTDFPSISDAEVQEVGEVSLDPVPEGERRN